MQRCFQSGYDLTPVGPCGRFQYPGLEALGVTETTQAPEGGMIEKRMEN